MNTSAESKKLLSKVEEKVSLVKNTIIDFK